MKSTAVLPHLAMIAALCIAGDAALAAHANPWAGEDDEVNAQFHDENQARSVGTPGEDEMRGTMTRNAFGKLGGAAGTSGNVGNRGAGHGNAGTGNGAGNGNGGGGNGSGGAGNGNR